MPPAATAWPCTGPRWRRPFRENASLRNVAMHPVEQSQTGSSAAFSHGHACADSCETANAATNRRRETSGDAGQRGKVWSVCSGRVTSHGRGWDARPAATGGDTRRQRCPRLASALHASPGADWSAAQRPPSPDRIRAPYFRYPHCNSRPRRFHCWANGMRSREPCENCERATGGLLKPDSGERPRFGCGVDTDRGQTCRPQIAGTHRIELCRHCRPTEERKSHCRLLNNAPEC